MSCSLMSNAPVFPIIFHSANCYFLPHYYESQSYTSQVLYTLEKCAHQSHLGRQQMGWYLADQPVHHVKLKY